MPTEPVTSTATRIGSRVRVVRITDVIAGQEPIVSVMTDAADILNFTPTTGIALAEMLIRACQLTVTVELKIVNTYPTLGESYTRRVTVEVPSPADSDDFEDWALEHLIPHTGEGPQYSDVTGVYEVTVTAAEDRWTHLIGRMMTSEG